MAFLYTRLCYNILINWIVFRGITMSQLAKAIKNRNINRTSISSKTLADVNVFIGINGSGKTTLLRTISGQVRGLEKRNRGNGVRCIDVDGDRNDPNIDTYWPMDVLADRISNIWVRAQAYNPSYIEAANKLITKTQPNVKQGFVCEDDDMFYADVEHKGESTQIYLLDMGAGFIQLMKIIAFLYDARGGFLCIDNLGDNLSMFVANDITLFIMEQAKALDIQVFVSTHCPTFLTAFKSQAEVANATYKVFNVDGVYRTDDNIDITPSDW